MFIYKNQISAEKSQVYETLINICIILFLLWCDRIVYAGRPFFYQYS